MFIKQSRWTGQFIWMICAQATAETRSGINENSRRLQQKYVQTTAKVTMETRAGDGGNASGGGH